MPATLLLTPALADSLADAVRRGVPIEAATQAAGISQQTFYEWLRAAESGAYATGTAVSPSAHSAMLAFSEKISRARADFEQSMVDAVRNAVGVVGASGIPEWRPALELLKHHPATRKRWGQHVQIEQHTTVSVEHRHATTLVDAALDAAFAALSAPAAAADQT